MIGDTEMGIYAACYKLAIFMNLYIMAFRLGAEPFFFNHAKNKDAKKTYARIMNYFVIIGALVFVVIVVYIDFLKELFIHNSEYWSAIQIVPIVLLAYLFLGIYHNLAIWYKLTDKTRFGMYFSIVGAVITIIINVWFIPKIGIMASAWATLIAYASMTIISYFIGKKHYPIDYPLKKMGVYLVISIVISSVSFLEYRGDFWVSTSMLFIFSGIIFWNERKEIKLLLNK